MTAIPRSPGVETLIRQLDQAVVGRDDDAVCQQVKEVLKRTVGLGDDDWLDPSLLRPAPDHYARRLLHRDPAGRYSVVLMVWGPGQGTDLHDHAGKWCVECVYRGIITVTSFAMVSEPDARLSKFRVADVVHARPGDAGALIPPFEYHTIENKSPDVAVTVHVYAAELTWCNAFLPVTGGFRRERRALTYTD